MERRAYLFVYGNDVGGRDALRDWVNTCDLVITWRYDMPNSFYVISTSSAQQLSDALRKRFPVGNHIFTEVSNDALKTQGWLPKESWYLLNNKILLE